MSISDAIGQIDQIVQWEQQLTDPAALTQSTNNTGGVAPTGDTSSSGVADTGASTSFANALAQAQSQDNGGASSTLDPTTLDPTTLDPTTLDPTTLDPTALDSATVDPTATAGTSGLSSTSGLLTGGDSQLLTALASVTGTGSLDQASATGPTDPRIQAMVNTANSLVGEPYVWGGGHDGWGPQSGYDCSGFVSAVLHAGGYLSTPQDTTTLPTAAGIESGPGRYVTIYDRDQPGESGHVIIEIDGQFYESGGEQGSWGGGGGVERISTPSAAYLSTFDQVLHPAGL